MQFTWLLLYNIIVVIILQYWLLCTPSLFSSKRPNLIDFILIFFAKIGVLDLHEACCQLGLNGLNLLYAKLIPNFLKLLIHALEMIILRLQFLFLLNVFLNHLLVEFLVIFFGHFEFVEASHLPHRACWVLTSASITENAPMSLSASLQLGKPICIFASQLIRINFGKFEFLYFLLKCQRIVFVSQWFGCIIQITNSWNWPRPILQQSWCVRINHLVIIALNHGLVILKILLTLHLKLCVVITGIYFIRCHIPAHLNHLFKHLKGISLAHIYRLTLLRAIASMIIVLIIFSIILSLARFWRDLVLQMIQSTHFCLPLSQLCNHEWGIHIGWASFKWLSKCTFISWGRTEGHASLSLSTHFEFIIILLWIKQFLGVL